MNPEETKDHKDYLRRSRSQLQSAVATVNEKLIRTPQNTPEWGTLNAQAAILERDLSSIDAALDGLTSQRPSSTIIHDFDPVDYALLRHEVYQLAQEVRNLRGHSQQRPQFYNKQDIFWTLLILVVSVFFSIIIYQLGGN